MKMQKISVGCLFVGLILFSAGCNSISRHDRFGKAVLVSSDMEEKRCATSAWQFVFDKQAESGEIRISHRYTAGHLSTVYLIDRTLTIKVAENDSDISYSVCVSLYTLPGSDGEEDRQSHDAAIVTDSTVLREDRIEQSVSNEKIKRILSKYLHGRPSFRDNAERCYVDWSYWDNAGKYWVGHYLNRGVFDIDRFFAEVIVDEL
jgi:hypothetical protein